MNRNNFAIATLCASLALVTTLSAAGNGVDAGARERLASLRSDFASREVFLRSLAIDVVEAPLAQITRAPQTLERARIEFHGAKERWVRSHISTPSIVGITGFSAPPANLLADLDEADPASLDVSDGVTQLSLGRREEIASWAGTLRCPIDPAMRTGALHCADLMWGDQWASKAVAYIDLVRVDVDKHDSDRLLWIFTNPFGNDSVDVHILVTSTSQRSLVWRHLVTRMRRADFESALAAYEPGERTSWHGKGKRLSDTSLEATTQVDGWALPAKTRRNASVAWFTYALNKQESDVAAVLFDPRRTPPETDGCAVTVTDARTREPITYPRAD